MRKISLIKLDISYFYIFSSNYLINLPRIINLLKKETVLAIMNLTLGDRNIFLFLSWFYFIMRFLYRNVRYNKFEQGAENNANCVWKNSDAVKRWIEYNIDLCKSYDYDDFNAHIIPENVDCWTEHLMRQKRQTEQLPRRKIGK